MWFLFFLVLSTSGEYELWILDQFSNQVSCQASASYLEHQYVLASKGGPVKDTYSFLCLKGKDKEA